jgi:hypothetical protein
LAQIEVQAVGPSDHREPAAKTRDPNWPVKVVLTPKHGDATRRFTLEVRASDADERVRTELRIKSGFLANQTRYGRVVIRDACLEQPKCEVDNKSCGIYTLTLDAGELSRKEESPRTWRTNCTGDVDKPDDSTTNPPDNTKPGDAGASGSTAATGGSAGDAKPGGSGGAGATTAPPQGIGTCPAGFILDAGKCVDIDECETFGHCAEHGRCDNLQGSYQCLCDPGFQADADACVDVNECQTNNGGCEGTCTNSIGGAFCACGSKEWLKVDRKTCGSIGSSKQISFGNSTIPMQPRIAFDPSGNGLAVWTFSDGSQTSLWTRRFVSGTGWMPSPARIDISDSGTPSEPRVALDATGKGVVVWLQTTDSNADVWAARFDGASVLDAAKIENNDTGSAYDPAIELNSVGDGFATWTQSDGSHARIWVNRFRADMGWSGALAVQTSTMSMEEAFAARLALDDAGDASLVWTQAFVDSVTSTSRFTPWSSRFDAMQGRWRVPSILDDTGSAGFADTQLFGPDGTMIAVWPRYADGRLSIVSRTFAPASGWGEPVAIASATSEFSMILPSVSLSAAGSGAALWTQTQGSTVRVWGSRYDGAMGRWSDATTLRMLTGATVPYPQIAVDPAGDGLAVWSEILGTGRAIWMWRLQGQIGFSEGARLSSDVTADPPANSVPQIAVDAQGNGMAIWDVQNGGTYTVWASRFE